MNIRPKSIPWLRRAWLLVLTGTVALALYTFHKGVSIQADMLALFPELSQRPEVQMAAQKQAETIESMVVISLSFDQGGTSGHRQFQAVANIVEEAIAKSVVFSIAPQDIASEFVAWRKHQYRLVDSDQLEVIRQQPSRLLEQTRTALYGIRGMLEPVDLVNDPLGLHFAYRDGFLPEGIEPLTPHVMQVVGEKPTLLAWLQISGMAFDMERSSDLTEFLAELSAKLEPFDVTMRASGIPVFAAAGASNARAEITLFGSISIIGVLGLFLLLFRNVRSLACVLITLGLAIGFAFVVTHSIFAEVHWLTLLFGVSLVGISVDYTLHYLCDAWRASDWSPDSGLLSVFPGITLAMGTSSLAFLTFLLAPFPSMQQIAVFAASGLFFAWFCVVGLLPWAGPREPSVKPVLALRLTQRWMQGWPFVTKRFGYIALPVVVLAIAFGFSRFNINDDVSLLQSASPDLLANDRYVRSLSPQQRASQFYLVQGEDEQALLRAEQRLVAELAGHGISTIALSQFYPDAKAQNEAYQAVKDTYFDALAGETPRLQEFFESLGSPALYAQAQVIFESQNQPLALHEWIRGAPAHIQTQWQGCDASACRSAVLLPEVTDADWYARIAENDPDVVWVDQVQAISQLLTDYRQAATTLLVLAFGVFSLIFMWIFGPRRGVALMLVPAGAILSALVVFALSGKPFNFFNLLGLMMVFGISIDYALFYTLHGQHRPSTGLAIALSAATTLLAFGMLSLSNTTIVQTVGLTLVVGILSAFLLAPLAIHSEADITGEGGESL